MIDIVMSKIKELYAHYKKWYDNREEKERQKEFQNLIDSSKTDYPELFSNDKYGRIISAYRELKNKQFQKTYYIIFTIVTLLNVWIAYQNLLIQNQNLQLQNPLILPVTGAGCTDFNQPLTYAFSFRNVGKSSGSLDIQLINSSASLEVKPQGLTLAPNDISQFILTSKEIKSDNFNFTLIVHTSNGGCFVKSCSYSFNSLFYLYKVNLDTTWQSCT